MQVKRFVAATAIAAGVAAIGLGGLARSQDKPGDKAEGCPNCAKDKKDQKGAAGNVSDEKAEPKPATGQAREIHLYTVDREWKFADGKTTWVMGYSNWDDDFSKAPEPVDRKRISDRLTVPSPTIRCKVGDHLRVTLHNLGNCCAPKESGFNGVTHTIHFHGLDLLAPIDGVPDLPKPGVPEGGEYTYDFVPDFEGTYTYHCHVDSASHILLGMYGLLIVDPADGSKTAYGYKYDREYSLCLSEMDTEHNEAMREKGRYDMFQWKSDYFLLNGRIFHANLENPLSTIADPKTRIKCKVGETVLLRFWSMGNSHVWAMHPHAYHMKVIATDGRRLDVPYWKDTLPIMSGERYDVLVTIGEKHKGVCQSCNIGKGVSIMHDHNMRGQTAGGSYPQGCLTIFEVE
jgi:FtsP/CotA-like multicopper oxidase with cupredoxin domain